MTLDECVYALADLLDTTTDCAKALYLLKGVLSLEGFSVDEVVAQFAVDYLCTPEVYVKNICDDQDYPLLDSEFDNL